MPTSLKLLPLLRHGRFTFPLAAVAALGMFLISETSFQRASATLHDMETAVSTRISIETLWRSLVDAETGQRGYLLTGRTEYLKPYADAQAEITQSLTTLSDRYRTDPALEALNRQLGLAARDKLSELAETIRLHDAGNEQAWRAVILSNIGNEQMATVRSVSQQLVANESNRLEQGRASVAYTLTLTRIGVTAMTAMCLLALFMYLRQTSAVVLVREEQRRLVQAERDRLEIDVAGRTEQLTQLTRHLQSVREEERNRLARELHDELGAWLTAAKLDVARLRSRLGVLTPEVAERLQHLNDGLNSVIALKRRIIEDLRPSSLSNLGLVAALEILAREWGAQNEITIDSEFEPVRLRHSGELTVYRFVQEALTNVSKYARASHVHIRLSAEDGRAHVSVRDDGAGFDPSVPRRNSHGLLGMRYRLEAESGWLALTSAPGQGTELEAFLPEASANAPDEPSDAAHAPAS